MGTAWSSAVSLMDRLEAGVLSSASCYVRAGLCHETAPSGCPTVWLLQYSRSDAIRCPSNSSTAISFIRFRTPWLTSSNSA